MSQDPGSHPAGPGAASADRPEIRPPAPRPRAFGALRHRNFRLFYGGVVVSFLGLWMHRVAQSWLVLELTDSAFYVGLVDALGWLPVLVFSLYAGALADRVSKRRLLLLTQIGAATFALTLAAFVLADRATIWHVVILAALLGVAFAFDIPARQSLVAELVGREDLTNAVALNASAFNGSRVVGPAIAGVLIAAVGVGVCFLINGLSYLPVVAALLVMRLPPHRPATRRRSALADIRDGLRFIFADVRIRALILNIATISIFGLPVLVLMPVVARDVLQLGAVEYGWMMSAVGLGALTGALILAVFGHRVRRGRLLAASSFAYGILVVLFAASRALPLVLLLLTLLGLTLIITAALSNTLLQTIAPDEMRGRVISLYALAFVGISPFGAVAAGAAAERFGTPLALMVGGAVCAVGTALGVMRSRAIAETR
jgi:MFS family permease